MIPSLVKEWRLQNSCIYQVVIVVLAERKRGIVVLIVTVNVEFLLYQILREAIGIYLLFITTTESIGVYYYPLLQKKA